MHPRHFIALSWILALALGLAVPTAALSARADIQFDVFVGYGDRVREGNWYPVAFEIHNDGPTFTGTVQFGPETDLGADEETRAFSIELPTGTRKRAVIPVFSSGGFLSRLDARLLDAHGKVLAERSSLQPKLTRPFVPLMGALPRTFRGLPELPEFKQRAPENCAAVARLESDYLPSNPIALEALSAIYVNSEKASNLKPEQIDALLAWVHGGGHLIVGIEQPGDVTALPWLRALLPFEPESVGTLPGGDALQKWLVSGRPILEVPGPVRRQGSMPRRRPPRPGAPIIQTIVPVNPQDPFMRLAAEPAFSRGTVPIVTGRAEEGSDRILSVGDTDLIVSSVRGRGTVTALAFSPEREPFLSWTNRAWFWAKLTGVPSDLLMDVNEGRWGGLSLDGLFGAMIDSRQVRKLPVAALLLLLVVYLVVIGPFDQWILKRTGKQMWTWVTFPLYVVLFSGLIYFIGYRLRAGDLEWNEIQVVDQLPRPDGAMLRGRTWASIYSPANARYRLASDLPFATLRGEFQQSGGNRGESHRLNLIYPARGFQAEAFVPVWVSQLYVENWLQPGAPVLSGSVTREGQGFHLRLENQSTLRFSETTLVISGTLYSLGDLPASGRIDRDLPANGGMGLENLFVRLPGAYNAAQQRGSAFGGEGSGQMLRDLSGVLMASFADHPSAAQAQGTGFLGPAGVDLSSLLLRGDAIVFGWAPEQALAPPMHRFSPHRLRRDTVVRFSMPVSPAAAPGIRP